MMGRKIGAAECFWRRGPWPAPVSLPSAAALLTKRRGPRRAIVGVQRTHPARQGDAERLSALSIYHRGWAAVLIWINCNPRPRRAQAGPAYGEFLS